MSPPGLAFERYCDYDALKPIRAAHFYLPEINKAETAANEDDGGDYDDKKGVDGGRSSAGRGVSSGVGDMRRAALVIGCGDSDLSARIASDQLEEVGFKSVLRLYF